MTIESELCVFIRASQMQTTHLRPLAATPHTLECVKLRQREKIYHNAPAQKLSPQTNSVFGTRCSTDQVE